MTESGPRLTAFAPQLLVDDLERSIAFYRDVLGFAFRPIWGGFYAIGERDGFEVHLKHASKTVEDRAHRRRHEHLDAYAGVVGIEQLYETCKTRGATTLKPLAATAWGTSDFYVEDPDGYIIGFGGSGTS